MFISIRRSGVTSKDICVGKATSDAKPSSSPYACYSLALVKPPFSKIDFGDGPLQEIAREFLIAFLEEVGDGNVELTALAAAGATSAAVPLSKFNYTRSGNNSKAPSALSIGSFEALFSPAVVNLPRQALWRSQAVAEIVEGLEEDDDDDDDAINNNGKDDANAEGEGKASSFVSLNEVMVRLGFAKVDGGRERGGDAAAKRGPLYGRLVAAGRRAKAQHLNMFRYGDAPNDSDED